MNSKDRSEFAFPKIRLNTIKSRFVFLISLAVIGSILTIQIISFFVFKRNVEENGKAVMSFATERLSNTIDEEYNSLMLISQMMTESGSIGSSFSKYLRASDIIEQKEAYGTMETALVTAMFSSGINMAIYYDTESGTNYMKGYQEIAKDFSIDDIVPLHKASSVDFQALHQSQSRYSNRPVVSVVRTDVQHGNRNIIAYLENESKCNSLMKDLCNENHSAYSFLLVDNQGKVCYCSDDAITLGSDLSFVESEEQIGKWDKYFWAKHRLETGGEVILFQPVKEFYAGVRSQMTLFGISILVSAFIIALTAYLLNQLIIKKNDLLQMQIEKVGEGNLEVQYEKTGLLDYDVLLERFNWMVQKIKSLIYNVEEKERQRGELEKELLYYRINPHFLLNTLNSAYWLARSNNESLDQFISQLTNFLRYSLGKDSENPTLRKELQVLEQYILIQKQRHDFSYEFHVEEGKYLDMHVPRLILQPIVENAIEHGIDDDGTISVQICSEDGYAVFTVTDNGTGMSAEDIDRVLTSMREPAGSPSIGLRYVDTMAKSAFGEKAEIKIESTVGCGTKVVLLIPENDSEDI